MAIKNDVVPIFNELSNVDISNGEQGIASYAKAILSLNSAQKEYLFTLSGLSGTQRDAVLRMSEMADGVRNVTVAQVQEIEELQSVDVARKLNAQSTDKLTASMLLDLVASGDLSAERAKELLTTNAQTTANEALGNSYKELSIKQKLVAGLSSITPLGWLQLALSILPLVVTGIGKVCDYFDSATERAHEAAEEMNSAFEETKSSLESVSSNLESSKSRLEELRKASNAGTITLVDKEELEDLEREVALLETKERLLKDQAEKEADDAYNATKAAYDMDSFSTVYIPLEFDVPEAADYYEENKDAIDAYRQMLNGISDEWDNLDIKEQEAAKTASETYSQMTQDAERVSETGLGWEEHVKQLIQNYEKLQDVDPSTLTDTDKIKAYEDAVEKAKSDLVDASTGLYEYVNNDAFKDLSEEYTQPWLDLYNLIDKCLHPTESIEVEKMDASVDADILKELQELGAGGTVDITIRPIIDSSELEAAGWDGGWDADSPATVFTSTYSDADGELATVAINFTPIMVDENGDYIGTLSPDELQEYAEGVIAGTREDDLNLQIGAAFTGDDVIERADAAANRIHELHDEIINSQDSATESAEEYKVGLKGLQTALSSVAEDAEVLSVAMSKLKDGDFNSWIATTTEDGSAENLEALLKAYPQLRDELEDYADGLIDASKLQEEFNRLLVPDALDEMGDAISSLKSAYDELNENGEVTYSTLSDIATQFADVDGIDGYISKLLAAQGNSEEFQRVMNDLTDVYIQQKLAGIDLANTDESLIAAMLDEAGIANSAEIAHRLVTQEKIENIAATYDLKTATDAEFVSLQNEIQGLLGEGDSAQYAAQYVTALRMEQILLNNSSLNTSASVNSLIELAAGLGYATTAMVNYSKVAQKIESGQGTGGLTGSEVSDMRLSAESEAKRIISSAKSSISSSFTGGSSYTYKPYTGSSSSGSSGSGSSGSSSSAEEDYVAEIDQFYRELQNIENIESRIAAIEEDRDLLAAGDYEQRTKYERDLVALYEQEGDALQDLIAKRKAAIGTNVSKLTGLGFSIDYDPETNTLAINNMEHINELTPSIRESTEELIETTKDLNSANQDSVSTWKNVQQSILDSSTAISENIVKQKENQIALNENWFDDAVARGDMDAAKEFRDNIVSYYKDIQDAKHEEAETYRAAGYLDDSDVIVQLSDDWWELRDSIVAATEAYYDAVKAAQDNEISFKQSKFDEAVSRGDLDAAREYTNEMTAMYQAQKQAAHDQAEFLQTEEGFDEYSDEVSAYRDTWWSLDEAEKSARDSFFEAATAYRSNQLTLFGNQLEQAKTDGNVERVKALTTSTIAVLKAQQEADHAQAEALRLDGAKDNSDAISELSDDWWNLNGQIEDAKDALVDFFINLRDLASDAVDEIQNVSSTLADAAQEYANNDGWISVDTYQSILDLGPEYMQMLTDENGLLVINQERINDVIAAKTRQLALEQAMTYVERLRLAATGQSNEDLNQLCFATTEATNSTWGLVYAELALMKQAGQLNDEQYEAALHNIKAIQALSENAISGVGQTAGAATEALEEEKEALESLVDELEDMKDGCDDLVDYVMDMLKDKIQQQIDALNDAKDAVSDYVDQLKEAMQAEKENADYEDEVAEKLKEIAKLQSKIDAISLDDSRKAQAEKASLEEELADLQKSLADTQAEHAIDATEDALDKQYDAYEDEKDAEIEVLEDSISSTQKLYDMA